MTNQVIALTIAGTVTQSGLGKLTLTASILGVASPYDVPVPVTSGDSASVVAQACRYALAIDATVSAQFQVSGATTSVILTDRAETANDTTMNLAITNNTSLGITPANSTITVAGAVATSATWYATLQQFKDYHAITSVKAVDDGVINILLESASRYIDLETGRRFYAATETRYYDTPKFQSSLLVFDEDCMGVTTVTNGNAATIDPSNYVLYPYNSLPAYGLHLVDNSSVGWLRTSYGNLQRAISILGSWGITPCPQDITECCLMIALEVYQRRFGDKAGMDSLMTPSGMLITPNTVPAAARAIMANHRKIGMA